MKLCNDFFSSLRQKAVKQTRPNGNGFRQVIQNLCQTVLLCLILGKYPWCRLINILIATTEQGKHFRNGICHTKGLHLLCNFLSCCSHNGLQVRIHLIFHAGFSYNAAKVLVAHGDGSVHKVAQNIGKLRVGSFNNQIPGNHAIIFKRHLMKNKKSCGIHTE